MDGMLPAMLCRAIVAGRGWSRQPSMLVSWIMVADDMSPTSRKCFKNLQCILCSELKSTYTIVLNVQISHMINDKSRLLIASSSLESCGLPAEPDVLANDVILVKPTKVIGKNVVFRNANKDDAEFILHLRTDPLKGKYLSPTNTDLDVQSVWLKRYESDNSQIYFIIENRAGEPYGTIRIYDVQGDSFCWGSWILKDGRPSGFAVESAVLIYQFAISLGFKKSHFDVRKENTSVWQFHERFGALRVGERDEDYIYEISHDAIKNSFEKYKKYVNDAIVIKA